MKIFIATSFKWMAQAVCWADVDTDLCHHNASQGRNESLKRQCLFDGPYVI